MMHSLPGESGVMLKDREEAEISMHYLASIFFTKEDNIQDGSKEDAHRFTLYYCALTFT